MMPKSLKTPVDLLEDDYWAQRKPLDDDYQAKLKALGQTAK